MKLIVAEKPSLGMAIANGLGIQKKHDGYVVCNGFTVTWCVGHLLELKKPDDYDAEYKNWNKMPMPFIPENWQYKPIPDKVKQLKIIKTLLDKSDTVVNAGDPDREGSMLVDIVIAFCGAAKKPRWRLLVSDLNLPAVKRAIAKIDKFNSTENLARSALARQRADYCYGLNLTVACTLKAQANGHDGLISIGRVQTPTLGMIVKRDLERENFVPHDYYVLAAQLEKNDEPFWAGLVLDVDTSLCDDNGRLTDKATAQSLQHQIEQSDFVVSDVDSNESKTAPPLGYSLSELQKDGGKKLDLTANEVLEQAQALYEAKITTYPRSSSKYLPTDHFAEAENILSSLQTSSVGDLVRFADATKKSRVFNDDHVNAHHAIVPTGNVANIPAKCKALFELIAQRYIAFFCDDLIVAKTEIAILAGDLTFKATGQALVQKGWTNVIPRNSKDVLLPTVSEGDHLMFLDSELDTKTTKPPAAYTEPTLVDAMTGIAKHLDDESLKPHLSETDGLGTEATRSKIIESLVDRKLIDRNKKSLISTKVGRELIAQLDRSVTSPDMTALWESKLNKVAAGELSPNDLLDDVQEKVKQLASTIDLKITAKELTPCPECGAGLRRLKGQFGYFWTCNSCTFKTDDDKGKPAKVWPCPSCSSKLVKREGEHGKFWACSNYKNGCTFTVNDKRNKPDFDRKKKK